VYEGPGGRGDGRHDEGGRHDEAGRHAVTGKAVMWCDGRRRFDLPPGARVEVRRGSLPVLLARVHGPGPGADGGPVSVGGPFTDRLVAKFGLPVTGWRGRAVRARGDNPPKLPGDSGRETAGGHA